MLPSNFADFFFGLTHVKMNTVKDRWCWVGLILQNIHYIYRGLMIEWAAIRFKLKFGTNHKSCPTMLIFDSEEAKGSKIYTIQEISAR